MGKFKRMLNELDEEGIVALAARLMKEGCWDVVSDVVLDRCNELGGDGLEEYVYDRAWGIANGC